MSDDIKNNEDDVEIEVEERPVFCYACGDQLNNVSSILICAECLGDECDDFLKKAQRLPKLYDEI